MCRKIRDVTGILKFFWFLGELINKGTISQLVARKKKNNDNKKKSLSQCVS